MNELQTTVMAQHNMNMNELQTTVMAQHSMNEMRTTLRTQHSMRNHSQTATSTHYHGSNDLPYVPSATQSASQLALFKKCHSTPTIPYYS